MKYIKHYELSETKNGDIWIGNTNKIKNFPQEKYAHFKTLRLGQQAYDIYGKKIPTNYCLPIFINKSEYNAYESFITSELRKI